MPAKLRFRRAARLTKPREFSRVFGRGAIRSSDSNLSVLARPNGLSRARLGMAIAKKCVRRAVDRNRIKRIVRDEFRHNAARLTGLDVVVTARPGADEALISCLRRGLRSHWHRLIGASGDERG